LRKYYATIPYLPPVLDWDRQAPQYGQAKPEQPGILYFQGFEEGSSEWVDCLLMFDENLELVGILNYYAIDFPPWEKAGNVTMFTHPNKLRRGIGSALMDEARRRWPVNFDRQEYTRDGAAFINRYVQRRSLSDGISRVTGTGR
jgi:GNAT superfamily N-acetyltransferase